MVRSALLLCGLGLAGVPTGCHLDHSQYRNRDPMLSPPSKMALIQGQLQSQAFPTPFLDDDDIHPNPAPWLNDLIRIEKKMNQTMKKEFSVVKNCTGSVIRMATEMVDLTANVDELMIPSELFQSWGLFLGDLGDYRECISGNNLYCAVQSNFSGYDFWSGMCLPPPCTDMQVQIIAGSMQALAQDGGNWHVKTVECFEAHLPMSFGAVITLVALAGLVWIALISTVCDLMLADGSDYRLRRRRLKDQVYDGGGPDPDDEPLLGTLNGDQVLVPADTQRCGCEEDSDHYMKRASLYHIFRCFSFKRSWRLLTSARKECSRGLRIFDGIRVLSIMWVLVGHTVLIQAGLYENGYYLIHELQSRPTWQIVLNASLASDTFFMMGGFFASYRVLHEYGYRGQAPSGLRAVVASLRLVLRRYFRLTPLLGLVLLFYVACLPELFSGPIWSHWLARPQFSECTSKWWTILVYGSNVLGTECMGWSWYTAVDMQLFLLVPPLTLGFWHYGLPAFGAVLLLAAGCIAANIAVVLTTHPMACEDDMMDMAQPPSFYDQQAFTRGAPYLVGVGLAFFYNAMGEFDAAGNLEIRPWIRGVIYVVAAVALALPVFGTYSMRELEGERMGRCRWSRTENDVYLSLFRVSWLIGIFLLASTFMVGWNGWLWKLLSARAWAPFSRLVYGVYLVHPIVIEIRAYGGNRYLDFSVMGFSVDVAGYTLQSFLVSLMLFLLVEGPLYQIRQLRIS